jgi:hypothetical protein
VLDGLRTSARIDAPLFASSPSRAARARKPTRLSCRSSSTGSENRVTPIATAGEGTSCCDAPLLVLSTDNASRVPDGYISLNTGGHPRALKTQAEGAICRTNLAASARPCTPVPHGNLHGKEGVDGSSPSEGSAKAPHIAVFSLRSICIAANVRQVWSRLWSFQVQKHARAGHADRAPSTPPRRRSTGPHGAHREQMSEDGTYEGMLGR